MAFSGSLIVQKPGFLQTQGSIKQWAFLSNVSVIQQWEDEALIHFARAISTHGYEIQNMDCQDLQWQSQQWQTWILHQNHSPGPRTALMLVPLHWVRCYRHLTASVKIKAVSEPPSRNGFAINISAVTTLHPSGTCMPRDPGSLQHGPNTLQSSQPWHQLWNL